MADYSQNNRHLEIQTPLGKDALMLVAFDGQESMDGLFSYQLRMNAKDDVIAAKVIVRQPEVFWMEYHDCEPRFFQGFVSIEFSGRSKFGSQLITHRNSR